MLQGEGHSGFSLVELMTVTAIIGVLASVAIPSYRGFQSKARQTEAKIALSKIYQVEKLGNVEHGYYTPCLTLLGYEPSPRRLYAQGFREWGGAEILDEDVVTTTGCGTTFATTLPDGSPTVPQPRVGVSSFDATYALPGRELVVAGGLLRSNGSWNLGFTASATGRLSTSLDAHDVWTIDQDQRLENAEVSP